MRFYHYEKGVGVGKVLALLKGGGGGHNKYWGSLYTVAKGCSHTEREVQNVSDRRFFHFIAPPPSPSP